MVKGWCYGHTELNYAALCDPVHCEVVVVLESNLGGTFKKLYLHILLFARLLVLCAKTAGVPPQLLLYVVRIPHEARNAAKFYQDEDDVLIQTI